MLLRVLSEVVEIKLKLSLHFAFPFVAKHHSLQPWQIAAESRSNLSKRLESRWSAAFATRRVTPPESAGSRETTPRTSAATVVKVRSFFLLLRCHLLISPSGPHCPILQGQTYQRDSSQDGVVPLEDFGHFLQTRRREDGSSNTESSTLRSVARSRAITRPGSLA